MTLKDKKALARRFIQLFSESKVDKAFELLSADFHWVTWGSLPFSGRNDKETVRRFADGLRDAFEEKPVWIVDAIIAEGDTVCVECHTVGDTRDGFQYRNHYHLAVTVHNDMISEIREYMDTQHCMALVASLQGSA
ncbi:MAG: hypothetical protein JWL66_1552 [Sphingomonadales bacterium]|jgi:ketosteroid isomerase-like protein|nr:hypothetical protein [Sphingomonadales bacterium]